MAKEISCGFVILNKQDTTQILACQAYGRSYKFGNCDIPKGHVEGTETHLETALRELKEETGFVVTDEKIHDCGLFQYLKTKDLHVFLIEADVDLTKLKCNSYFENQQGVSVPEVIKFHWVTDTKMFYRSLGPVVQNCIDHYHEGLV